MTNELYTHVDFSNELEQFIASVEDGTVFNSIGTDVWDLVNKIVSENPNIVDNL